MIEIEKKFLLKDGDEERLLEGAEFVSETVMRDVYMDRADWSLTKNDWWLRGRNGKFELKEPMHELGHSKRDVDQYREYETDGEILAALDIDGDGDIDIVLTNEGFEPIVDVTTTRRKYKHGDFTIVIDEMDFGYQVCEIELLVDERGDMKGATDKILEFARSRGLETGKGAVDGKVIEYMKRHRPDHYQALLDAGVL